ncbi:MAG: YifB family Mg chelatase-like AAA ATPase [Actinomycetaceae bacterium]|nr:YifB family Mg chelatase-like AAA ATPase [Actinomycetaceae bacterium]
MNTILVRTLAMALTGLDAHVISVETHVGRGLVSFNLVGLPDASVREARDRVRAALQSCGVDWFERRITINLSPAGIPKNGSAFDLAIAVGMLCAHRQLKPESTANTVFMAELGLDGSLRPVRGVLPAVIGAAKAGIHNVVVAQEAAAEAALVPGISVRGYRHLSDLVQDLGGTMPADHISLEASPVAEQLPLAAAEIPTDLADVRGQSFAAHGLIIAAAGGHHMLMMGEPGAGKTMLAKRLPTILPDLEDDDAIDVTAIHSLAGTYRRNQGLIRRPPIQAPHHNATMPSIIGGGSGLPSPGAVSLAHAGVLFLDESAEFAPSVLDCLRQPLENGHITIHRARGHLTYPARFQLVLATNPCPCGHAISRRKSCTCSSIQQRRYLNRLSGPLLDRIDIQVTMQTPTPAALAEPPPYTSAQARDIVEVARQRARIRWENHPWSLNAHAPSAAIRDLITELPTVISDTLNDAVNNGVLSLRGADRVLRIALTIADMREATMTLNDLTSALQYRNGTDHASY